MEQTERTIYSEVGGMEFFHRLADAFYTRVEADAFLLPMFRGPRDDARKHLALFLAQYFGGPTDYNALRGHPRLRMRHMPFVIGQEERDHWLSHMLAALEEVGVPEPARTVMTEYLTSTATFLMNKPGPTVPITLVARPSE